MKIKLTLASLLLSLTSWAAFADLEPFVDYEMSDSVWALSTVKVDANMGDAYLEGLKKTWVASNEISKQLGHIESYSIFRSDLPQSGDFNLLLLTKFANTSDLAPNKKRYKEFMEKWGKENSDESTEISQKNYPGMRTITGDYLIREITIK
ncbi:MAG: hypothetical protein AB8B86_11720 [Pseudomonadales bacterium]